LCFSPFVRDSALRGRSPHWPSRLYPCSSVTSSESQHTRRLDQALVPRGREPKFNRVRKYRPITDVIEAAEVGFGPLDGVAERLGIHLECRLARPMFMARIVADGLHESHVE